MTDFKTEKFFNTAGPCKEDINYMTDPLRRVSYGEITALIGRQRYFVLHAPRQTGKTTSLLAMVNKINGGDKYRCVYVNVESAQTARNDVQLGMQTILSAFASAVEKFLGMERPGDLVLSLLTESSGHGALKRMLEIFCKCLDKPLVLFMDEIDSLVGDTLVSVLRQLRDAYANRPRFAPISVILCGVRDVRDYRIHRSDGEIITGGSCFNVKAESLRLGDFSQDEIRELYLQHTEATGQKFGEGIFSKVWELTHGQPWLVNALANQAAFKMSEGRDRSRAITPDIIDEAAERLILERATHLDQLADKLREDRVRRVMASMLSGNDWPQEDAPEPDDIQYTIDLGLIRRDETENGKPLVISNAMYREVIPRELTSVMRDRLEPRRELWYVKKDGGLCVDGLLRSFQQFFRENSESWLERFDYKEAGFQLLLQAFLQRVVNGGGTVGREYALGLGRVDILIRWRYPKGAPKSGQYEQRAVLELKTIRGKSPAAGKIIADGLEQTARYAERSGADEAHLIICDERPGRSWDEKIYERDEYHGGRTVKIWGL